MALKPDVHRLAANLETAIEDGDVRRVVMLIDAARMRRQDRLDVARLLSGQSPVVVLAFDRYDQARIMTAA
jgi:hypothetical protein